MPRDPEARAARRQAKLDRKLARLNTRADRKQGRADRHMAKLDRKFAKIERKLSSHGVNMDLTGLSLGAPWTNRVTGYDAYRANAAVPETPQGREMVHVGGYGAGPAYNRCGGCGSSCGRRQGPRGPIGLLAMGLGALAIAGKKKYESHQAGRARRGSFSSSSSSSSSSSDSDSDSEGERRRAGRRGENRRIPIPVRDAGDLPRYEDEKVRGRVVSAASSVVFTPSPTATRESSVAAPRNEAVEARERAQEEADDVPPPSYLESVSGRVARV